MTAPDTTDRRRIATTIEVFDDVDDENFGARLGQEG